MSLFLAFQQAVGSVHLLRGVKRCLVVTRTDSSAEDHETLPPGLIAGAIDVARGLFGRPDDRRSERMFGHVVVARRFDEVALVVIGDELLDENDVQRKLNVIAIKVQVSIGREGPSADALALREAYVSVAGPISGIVFDRAVDDLRRTKRDVDRNVLQAFAQSLVDSLTPPTNYQLRDRFNAVMRSWGTLPMTTAPSGQFRAAAPIAPPAPAPTGASRNKTPPGGLRRPTTVPQMAAVQHVVRELVGPLGDLLVQRALESATQSGAAPDATQLMQTIADQLPAQHRDRFLTESRAALVAAAEAPADPEAPTLPGTYRIIRR